MTAERSAIPVLGFRAGELCLAVAAEDGTEAASAFLADPLVEVLLCRAGHIVPMARSVPLLRLQPIMGFARIDERLHMLLDIEGVIRALHQERTGGEP